MKFKIILDSIKSRKGWVLIAVFSALIIVIIISIFTGYGSYFVNIYPQLPVNPKGISLKCNYAGKNIEVKTVLNANVNNYYHYNTLKRSYIKKNDFSKIVYFNPQDNSIKELANKIKSVGSSNGLNNDQILELTTCFIQNIPYDEDKAKIVLSNKNISDYDLVQFPYETLYKNKGICTDKTYLGSMLLKELGYGTGILIFPEKKHMALGINTPSGYSDFNSKYAIIELTNTGFMPGDIPYEISNNNGKPSLMMNNLNNISSKDDPSKMEMDLNKMIKAPTLIAEINNGKLYNRIVIIKDLRKKIIQNILDLSTKKITLNSAYNELQRRNTAQLSAYSYYLSILPTTVSCGYSYGYLLYSYPRYICDTVPNPQKNFAYNSYIYDLESYNNQVDYYNNLINDYNVTLERIRGDIRQYQSYRYN